MKIYYTMKAIALFLGDVVLILMILIILLMIVRFIYDAWQGRKEKVEKQKADDEERWKLFRENEELKMSQSIIKRDVFKLMRDGLLSHTKMNNNTACKCRWCEIAQRRIDALRKDGYNENNC